MAERQTVTLGSVVAATSLLTAVMLVSEKLMEL